MPVLGFEKIMNIRIQPAEYKKIKRVVRKNEELFYNPSHFVRSSIMRYLREFDKKGKRKEKKDYVVVR